MGWLTGLFGFLGTAVKGIFGFKSAQADAIGKAIESIKSASKSDEAYAAAAAASITALYEQGPLLERLWRPSAMWIFLGLIVARFFGYVPPGLSGDEVGHIYRFFEIGLIGYLPLRSIDKWMRGFQVGNILKDFIAKKLI